jgi:hypothetical protein
MLTRLIITAAHGIEPFVDIYGWRARLDSDPPLAIESLSDDMAI